MAKGSILVGAVESSGVANGGTSPTGSVRKNGEPGARLEQKTRSSKSPDTVNRVTGSRYEKPTK